MQQVLKGFTTTSTGAKGLPAAATTETKSPLAATTAVEAGPSSSKTKPRILELIDDPQTPSQLMHNYQATLQLTKQTEEQFPYRAFMEDIKATSLSWRSSKAKFG